jgi:hypothetical protein
MRRVSRERAWFVGRLEGDSGTLPYSVISLDVFLLICQVAYEFQTTKVHVQQVLGNVNRPEGWKPSKLLKVCCLRLHVFRWGWGGLTYASNLKLRVGLGVGGWSLRTGRKVSTRKLT